ncbi:hypothetical protein VB780_06815 [Leptolyngbya sp. CCNP1308]|uniref:hypothetical protein n=1 Tax=Leptolyngbya sp. CCNP1308 TaxID=3110255 RepID=UPI002B20DDD2|nr:hypothetical protein [Leptolyngbya sp. CCNP1308]MEA5448271.1 hypothetical protein [Leptolyngbya sp. CCNP1308]
MSVIFTQILGVQGAGELLRQGFEMSRDIGDIYSLYWTQLFTSELYTQITGLALIFAVGALVLFMMRFAYMAVHEDDYREPLRMLVWPLIVVALLSNQGNLLGISTRSVRDVINRTNEQVLQVSMLNVTLEEAIRGAIAKGVVVAEVDAQVQQCQSLLGEAQIQCLEMAYEQIEATVGDFKQHWLVTATGMAGSVFPQIDMTLQMVRGAIDAYNTDGSVGDILPGAFGGLIGSQSRVIIHAFLMAFQWAFVNLIQISLLLTALMGPFAVAASLLPFGGKPIFAWITGFLSLGFAQMAYNIIVGMCAVVIMNANTFDTNGFLVLIALLAPALALGLASGGGLAIFNIMLAGSTGAATILLSRMALATTHVSTNHSSQSAYPRLPQGGR